ELLAGNVDDGVGRLRQPVDHRPIPDIAPDQFEARVIGEVGQVRLGTRPADGVQSGDQDLRVSAEPVTHERRPEEPGATSDQEVPDPELAHDEKTTASL